MHKQLLILFCLFIIKAPTLCAQEDSPPNTTHNESITIGCGFGTEPQVAKEPYTIFQTDTLPYFLGKPLERNEPKYFQEQIKEYIVANFDAPILNDPYWSGVQSIAVQFIIENTGEVSHIEVRARNKEMEAYTLEIINCLPKFEPGVRDSKKVAVTYSLPIRYYPEDK
ncbi:MAG: hypothetical protein Aureis2KO_26860 [Aureisphaera sp.]